MKVNINKENKINNNLSLEGKPDNLTWDEADWTWDEASGTWKAPGVVLKKESKNNVNLNLEPK